MWGIIWPIIANMCRFFYNYQARGNYFFVFLNRKFLARDWIYNMYNQPIKKSIMYQARKIQIELTGLKIEGITMYPVNVINQIRWFDLFNVWVK